MKAQPYDCDSQFLFEAMGKALSNGFVALAQSWKNGYANAHCELDSSSMAFLTHKIENPRPAGRREINIGRWFP